MKLDLQTRDLLTGDRSPKAFDSEEQALAWLKERPTNTAVLGVASHHVPAELADALKQAMRPLDDDEKSKLAALDQADADALTAMAKKQQEADMRAAEQRVEAMKNADPNRPMQVRYRFDSDLTISDKADSRTVTAEAREAVEAWVAERQEWVKSRGQIVGEATVTVWPAEMPEGTTERVQSGTFVPVTA